MKINRDTKIVGKNVVLVPYEICHVPKYHMWMQSKELQALTASEPLSLEEEYAMQRSWREDEDKCTFIILQRSVYEDTNNEIDSMIGDTNLFINYENKDKAEIEIMIAEPNVRRKGLGLESTILMLVYGIEHLNVKTYQAKISFKNNISIQMFQKLGFQETTRSEIFQEVTLEKSVSPEWLSPMTSNYKFIIENYKTIK